MPKKVTLKNEKILDNWSVLIDGAQGKRGEVYQKTTNFIVDSKAPGVSVGEVKVRPGFLAGLLGRERSYLMVTSEALKDYRMYIGARDYGKNLDVAWYLTCEPRLVRKTFSKVFTGSEKAFSLALDIFQQQDLVAYATCVHHCLLKAVDSLMRDLGQDPSKIERKSRGFLGIS